MALQAVVGPCFDGDAHTLGVAALRVPAGGHGVISPHLVPSHHNVITSHHLQMNTIIFSAPNWTLKTYKVRLRSLRAEIIWQTSVAHCEVARLISPTVNQSPTVRRR